MGHICYVATQEAQEKFVGGGEFKQLLHGQRNWKVWKLEELKLSLKCPDKNIFRCLLKVANHR